MLSLIVNCFFSNNDFFVSDYEYFIVELNYLKEIVYEL